jgi:hypothetical protein
MQGLGACCESRWHAALAGHFNCYQRVTPYGPEPEACDESHPYMRVALQRGNVEFAERFLLETHLKSSRFARDVVQYDDAVSLSFILRAAPGMDLKVISGFAGMEKSIRCLRFLLKNGATWDPSQLRFAARDNRQDILDLVLPLTKQWSPLVPTVAACLGHVRFLMRVFDAGCPTWTCANDGEPMKVMGTFGLPWFYPVGRAKPKRLDALGGWCLLVSSDLVVSGPVLLYAAQKGAPLTPRMHGMLGEVRGRALALAGCFRKASRPGRGPTKRARKWQAMGRVPTEIVERIATLARISIVALDLVE